jgi:lipopolysaccharide transport system ATP-binding protein
MVFKSRMSDVAISVENISKCYRIGTQGGPAYHRLSEMITGVPRALWNAGKSLVRESSTAAGAGPDVQNTGEFWALKDVSFEIKQGEVVGIIGRNGAGKSTLLKILSRITEPTSGRFGVRGRVASLLEVGTGFHPELTGRENIYVSGITLGMTRAEIKQHFDEIVEFSGVEKFLDTPVKHYSSGMQVRLGFAVAAHLESEILIVDEVLAVGDAEFQKKCTKRMHDVSGSGVTVILVSHSIPSIKHICRSAVHLSEGRLAAWGTVATVVDSYSSSYEGEKVDLSQLRRRRGRPLITDVWLNSEGHSRVKSIVMGRQFSISFSFQVPPEHRSGLLYGCGVDSQLGYRVFSINNEMLGVDLHPRDNSSQGVRINFRSPNLSRGRYFVSVSLVHNGEWLDYLESALSFEVLDDDVYGTGKIPDGSQGCVFATADMELIE